MKKIKLEISLRIVGRIDEKTESKALRLVLEHSQEEPIRRGTNEGEQTDERGDEEQMSFLHEELPSKWIDDANESFEGQHAHRQDRGVLTENEKRTDHLTGELIEHPVAIRRDEISNEIGNVQQ